MTKRLFLFSLIGVALLVLGGTPEIEGKAHVPLGRAQICTAAGTVDNVPARRMQTRIANGACRLTICAFNDVDDDDNVTQQYVFLAGDDCDPVDDNGDGFCDATGRPSDVPKRLRARGVTPACTDPTDY